MRSRPLGTHCALTYDWSGDPAEAHGAGDLLVTDGGSGYLIIAARPVRRRVPLPEGIRVRLHLDCIRHDPTVAPEDGRVIGLVWYRREKRR